MKQFHPSRVSESLDSMDDFYDSSSYHQSRKSLGLFSSVDKVKAKDFASIPYINVDGIGGNTLGNSLVKLHTHENSVEPETEDTSGDVSLSPSSQNESVGINLEGDECVKERTPSRILLTRYFPDFPEHFDELHYPKGDLDAVSLSKRDVDLLQPDTCINDTIIDFYLLYLKNKIQEKEKARFHFFNSFFFRKLADMEKNQPNACDSKSAFQRVHRWTRKVNLFEKDYIFIPVNFNHHWSLLVICNPGEVVNINDKEPEKSLRLPCIMHMDSIKGYHSGLKDLVQSYLCEEWKERKKGTCGEDLSSRFLNMRFLQAEVPQQENEFDCGLFLLHYLELFLAEVPFDFNPLILSKFSNFLNLDWFPPAEAYFKRTLIHRLIFELVKNHDNEGFFHDNVDDHHSSEYNDNNIGGQCHLINGEESTSHAGRGIEMAPSFDTSSMVLKDHYEPEATLGTSLRHCQSIDRRSSNHCFNGSIFKMEEDTDLNAHRQAEHVKAESSLDTSSSSLDDSDDVEIIENLPVKKESRSNSMFVENLRPLQDMNNSAATFTLPDLNDPAEFMETSPVKNESRSSLEDGRKEKKCKSIEKLEHFPDMNDYVDSATTLNLPVKKESTYWMSIENIRHLLPKMHWYQVTPTLQLYHVSDAVHNKVIDNDDDDVQIIDNLNLDFLKERPPKKRRLMSPWVEVMES